MAENDIPTNNLTDDDDALEQIDSLLEQDKTLGELEINPAEIGSILLETSSRHGTGTPSDLDALNRSNLSVAGSASVQQYDSLNRNRTPDVIVVGAPPPSSKHGKKKKKRHRSRGTSQTSYSSGQSEKRAGVVPTYSVGLLSYITAHWFTRFALRVYRQGEVLEKDIWSTHDRDTLKTNGERFERLWKEELVSRGKDRARLHVVIWKFARKRALIALAINLVCLAFALLVPTVCIRGILVHTQSTTSPVWYGLLLVLMLAVCEILHRVLFTASWIMGYHFGLHINAGIMDLMYNKLLRMHSLRDKSPGKVINIFMTDIGRIFEASIAFPSILSGPITVLVAVVYSTVYLGPWALVGALVIFGYYPCQYFLGRKNVGFRRQNVVNADKRIRKMTEILTNIKLIKFYCWEQSFSKVIRAIREGEFRILQRVGMVHTLGLALGPLVPVLTGVLMFVAHTLAGNELDAAQPFVVLSVLFLLRPKLAMTPVIVKSYSDSLVALKRIQSLLVLKETLPLSSFPQPAEPDVTIEITDGTFAWEQLEIDQPEGSKNKLANGQNNGKVGDVKETETLLNGRSKTEGGELTKVLYDINLKIYRGQLIGICGVVGSGKSSFLSAILAQIEKLSGLVCVRGRVAYVPQQAWILNSTLRENITFGLPYDKQRYTEVLAQCCLAPDIAMLPAGDLTEIGERGINLSGGQKQRVSLARAVYSQHDVFLLDDPLSAVDVHVGQRLYDNVLKGALRGRTVIFVTHQLQYLSGCDYVIHMKAGRILECGTHQELLANSDSQYASLINTYYQQLDEEETTKSDDPDPSPPSSPTDKFSDVDLGERIESALQSAQSVHSLVASNGDLSVHGNNDTQEVNPQQTEKRLKQKGQLIDKEEIDKGAVTLATYRAYARAGGGYICFMLVLATFLIPVTMSAVTNWWLSHWIDTGAVNTTVTVGNETQVVMSLTASPHLYYYISVYCVLAVTLVITLCLRGFLYIRTALVASRNIHNQVFSKVLESPMSFYDTTPVGRTLNRFSKDMDVVDMTLPQRSEILFNNLCTVLVSVALVAIIYPWMLLLLVPIALAYFFALRFYRVVLRELKRVESVTRSPVSSILTTTLQGLNMVHAYNKQDDFRERFHEACNQNLMLVWMFSIANRWLSCRLDLGTVLVTVVTSLLVVCMRDHVPTAMAGLALIYASTLTGLTQFTLRMASETESLFTSVERIRYYTEVVKSEASRIIADSRPAPTWPSEGAIVIRDASLRYRPQLPLVLAEVNCEVRPREKVGIVGRTGAGKSSLAVALFRLVELDAGTIEIDGVDISTIGLEDLRSKLSIIPQDPAMFSGTLRYNLDPFSRHTDFELWQALSQCHVKDKINSLPNGLAAPVEENGANFSVGERQLICMARALLRNSKILILDEATASIDTETDAKIQTTIREAFRDCTMLTIAHRIHTIMEYDRVMVLDKGTIVEFGEPRTLEQNPNSYFRELKLASEMDRSSTAST